MASEKRQKADERISGNLRRATYFQATMAGVALLAGGAAASFELQNNEADLSITLGGILVSGAVGFAGAEFQKKAHRNCANIVVDYGLERGAFGKKSTTANELRDTPFQRGALNYLGDVLIQGGGGLITEGANDTSWISGGVLINAGGVLLIAGSALVTGSIAANSAMEIHCQHALNNIDTQAG